MTRNNNFDFLRLLFAIFVIVSHSYPLSASSSCDLLCLLTDQKLVFSYIGVSGFFIISGYLIFQSLLRSESLVDYFWKRFLRLFPALFVVLLLTILLAPIVYEGNVSYWSNKSSYSYFYKNLSLFRLQYSIKGVFENNVYGSPINGSLWTLCYEFSMYLILSVLFFFKTNNRLLKIVFIAIYVAFVVYYLVLKNEFFFNFYQLSSLHLAELGMFFLGGSFLALINFEKINFLKSSIIISGILIVLSEMFFEESMIFRFILWPVFIIGLGIQSTKYISCIGDEIGDLSYGVYIYGFPIQQTLMHYFKLNAIELMLLAVPLSLVFGYISWHLIESTVLKYKKKNLLEIKFLRNVIKTTNAKY